MTLLAFFLGLAIAAGIGYSFWWQAQRQVALLDEDKEWLAQSRRLVLDFMHDMVEAVGEGVDRQELCQRVVHASVLSTGALSACLYLREDERLRGVAVEGLFPPTRPLPDRDPTGQDWTRTRLMEHVMRSEQFDAGEGLVGEAAESGRGILVADALRDARVVQHGDSALIVRSLMVVPVSFGDKNLGVLALANPSDGEAFNENDFSLATSLAEQAALAIHNLDLMQHQLERRKLTADLGLAREIQSMLLPKRFPETGSLDFAAVYQPAQEVGGDLFDAFSLDDNCFAVAVADVSGKGIPASLVMATCQANLRHLAHRLRSPLKVITELNRLVREEIRPDMFVTLIYAVIDLSENAVTFARAGHELPLLVQGDGNGGLRTQRLESRGTALGLLPDALYAKALEEHRVAFVPGDVFVLYTDGVTEAADAQGSEFSSERLADVVQRWHSRDTRELNEAIMDDITSFVGPGALLDDMTILTIKHL